MVFRGQSAGMVCMGKGAFVLITGITFFGILPFPRAVLFFLPALIGTIYDFKRARKSFE